MAKIAFLGKTIDAMHLLRQPDNALPTDARTLLLLVDGHRHTGELRALAAANDVDDFDGTLDYLHNAGLVQTLPEIHESALSIDETGPGIPAGNLITLDFAVPKGAFDKIPLPASAPARPAAGSASDGAQPSAGPALPDAERRALHAALVAQWRPKIEAELRTRLLPELRTQVVRELRARLEPALRQRIEQELRAELKPRVEQEFRDRMEAAIAARLQAAGPPASGNA